MDLFAIIGIILVCKLDTAVNACISLDLHVCVCNYK